MQVPSSGSRDERLLNPEQEERNRKAFEGWLWRKNEERKRQRAAEQRAQKASDVERVEQQKRAMALRAYQQWLLNKKQEQQQKKKEKKIEEELQRLFEEQKEAEHKMAQESFLTWKKRKDLEQAMEHQNTRTLTSEDSEDLPSVMQTPVLPGYCSVWSCDEDLADHMLARVCRPSTTHQTA